MADRMIAKKLRPDTELVDHGDRTAVPSLSTRLLIAFFVAVISGAICGWNASRLDHGGGDFTPAYVGGRALLTGGDPLAPSPDPDWVPYPLPAAFFGVLFAPFPIVLASAAFFGISSGLLAFGLTQKRFLPLMTFLAAPYWVALTWAQWSPLIVASGFFPVLAVVVLMKPHVAAPVVLTRLSKVGLISIAVFFVLSIAIYPTWPLVWIKQLGPFQHYFPLLTIPGPLLLLALTRRHDRDARLLLLASVFPQRWLYDAFILWLIPKTRQEFLFTALASWIGWEWRLLHMPRTTMELGLLCVLCFYLPMLVIILRRPKQVPSGV
jgi:hypothetical protein